MIGDQGREPELEVGDGEGPEVGEGLAVDLEAEGLGLEASAPAVRAGGVGAVAAEEDADVHLVGLRFQPVEEAFDAIPFPVAPEFLQLFHVHGRAARAPLVFTVSVVDPFTNILVEILPGASDVDVPLAAVAEQVLLAFVAAFALEGLDRALADREAGIGDGLVEIEPDDATEATAFRAGTEGVVEGEEGWDRGAEGEAGGGVVPGVGEGAVNIER